MLRAAHASGRKDQLFAFPYQPPQFKHPGQGIGHLLFGLAPLGLGLGGPVRIPQFKLGGPLTEALALAVLVQSDRSLRVGSLNPPALAEVIRGQRPPPMHQAATNA